MFYFAYARIFQWLLVMGQKQVPLTAVVKKAFALPCQSLTRSCDSSGHCPQLLMRSNKATTMQYDANVEIYLSDMQVEGTAAFV